MCSQYLLIVILLVLTGASCLKSQCNKPNFLDILCITKHLTSFQSDYQKFYCLERNLIKSVSKWKLNTNQKLLKNFPLDPVTNNYVRRVKGAIFSKSKPTPLGGKLQMVAWSEDVLRNVLNLETSIVNSENFLRVVSGSTVLANSAPLAHRYGGHQFGVWAGQLGDGRAHILGEYTSREGVRWELQLKGSGNTPYSREGDGRAVLRSSVREFLASEAMYHLSIPTTRAATLIVSEERVRRDQFYSGNIRTEPTAVVLRLAPSWFRFGSFEILALDEPDNRLLKLLSDFVIEEYFPEINEKGPERYLALFSTVVEKTAVMLAHWVSIGFAHGVCNTDNTSILSIAMNNKNIQYLALFSTVLDQTAVMLAHWMSVGFAHGVCNTDNFSILSLTIDYGPFRFLDHYDPDTVPNTSDDEHRYAFSKQPDVAKYNLQKLGAALSKLLTREQDKLVLHLILDSFDERYRMERIIIFRCKLGLRFCDSYDLSTDEAVINNLLDLMSSVRADFTMSFRQLGDIDVRCLIPAGVEDTGDKDNSFNSAGVTDQRVNGDNIHSAVTNKHNCKAVKQGDYWALDSLRQLPKFNEWIKIYVKRLEDCNISEYYRRTTMHSTNPRYVLRNWVAQQAINAAEQGDFSLVRKLNNILATPFREQEEAELLGLADRPPNWAENIKVSCSS